MQMSENDGDHSASWTQIIIFSVSSMNTMSELELEDDCRFRPTTENYVTIVSFCLIFCLSVVGNSVVVVVIVQVSAPINIFLVRDEMFNVDEGVDEFPLVHFSNIVCNDSWIQLVWKR